MTRSEPLVAVVFYNIGPYHHARLNAAARTARIVACEWSARENHPWGRAQTPALYEKVTLLDGCSGSRFKNGDLEAALIPALERVSPTVVAVNGWNDFGSMTTISCCVRKRVPIIVMSESSAHDERRVWWKEFVKRQIIGLASAGLVGGRLHAEYLAQLGMSREQIFTGYDVVDNAHFAVSTDSEGRRNKPYFLASARFIPKKNLSMLLAAYARYRFTSPALAADGHPWPLVLLGDGPLRRELEAQVAALGLVGDAQLPGFKQYPELPAWYANAGAFVHASTIEQWGLVVNEAAAAGLPLIASNRCGCVPELVEEGVNGWSFDPNDVDSLAKRLRDVVALPLEARLAMGQQSRRRAAAMHPRRFGEGLRGAVSCAVSVPRPNSGLASRALLSLLSRC